MTLLPRPKLPRIPGRSPSVRPVLSEAEKAIRRQKNAKRKKKCVKATSFPCGFTCLPKMTKAGNETICRNVLRGQAVTFTKWLALVQERAAQANNRRLEKGKAGIYIRGAEDGKLAGTVGIIGRESPPKNRKNKQKTLATGVINPDQKLLPPATSPKRKKAKVNVLPREKRRFVDDPSETGLQVQVPVKTRRNTRQPKQKEEPIAVPLREPVQVIEKEIITDRRDLLPKFDPELVPSQLRDSLSPEGIEGVSRAIEAMDSTGGFLLADGTGVGKSRQQLSVAQHYAEQGKKVLIISPNAVIKPDYKSGVVSGSFADDSKAMGVNFTLNKGDTAIENGTIHLATYQNLDKLKAQVDSNTVLILDEAHNLKNLGSQRTKHGMEMLDNARAVLYATATPADKPEHLFYLHRLGANALARHMGIKRIEVQNADGSYSKKWVREKQKAPKKKVHGAVGRYVEREKAKAKKPKVSQATLDAIAVTRLFDELTGDGTMLRREIGMNGIKVNMTDVTVPKEAQEIMDKIEGRYLSGRGDGMSVARQLMDQRRQLEPFKVPEASRLALEAVQKGRQVLIFADRVNKSEVLDDINRYRKSEGLTYKTTAESEGTIPLLRKQLEAMGIDPEDIVEMHGGADIPQSEALERFQSGKAKIMIGTSKVMGTGINADDTVGDRPRTTIMMTPEFSASDFMQVLGRTWRRNTNSIPDFHVLFSDLGVDQWGKALLSTKLATLGAAVGGSPKNIEFRERSLRGFGFHFDR